MRLIDADALMAQFPCTCECKHCGEDKDGILPCDIKDKIKAAPTIIDCGVIEHETLGKIPYMDLRPRMTADKLDEITSRVCDIFRNAEFYDCIFCKNSNGGIGCFDCEKTHTVFFLLGMIASLHNELYKQVKGKYYDYMFHWANLGYGGSPNDSMFKDKKEGDDNDSI